MRATDETLRLDLDDLKYIITLIIVQRILLNSIEQSTRFNNSERKHFREKYEEINLNKIISASVVAKRKRAPCVQDGIQIVSSSQINRQGRVSNFYICYSEKLLSESHSFFVSIFLKVKYTIVLALSVCPSVSLLTMNITLLRFSLEIVVIENFNLKLSKW